MASTSLPGGDDTIPPFPSADKSGPSATITGRETTLIPPPYAQVAAELQPLLSLLQPSSILSSDDSSKTTKAPGTTLVPDLDAT